jgi:hypothetical protein
MLVGRTLIGDPYQPSTSPRSFFLFGKAALFFEKMCTL